MAQTYLKPDGTPTGPSFPYPVPAPATDPSVGPFLCAKVPAAYMPFVLGALSQLLQPFAWRVSTDADRRTILDWMDTFLADFAAAEYCYVSTISVTISAGVASGTASATFPDAFSTIPVVVVSADNPDLIASTASVTTDGFDAVLTANVEVPSDVTATVSYIALVAS